MKDAGQKPMETDLHTLIKWLCHGKKLHFCVHDVSGVLHSSPRLTLPPGDKMHQAAFCDAAKTTCAGMRYCLRCKRASILRAVSQDSLYTGQCYLGVSEIVKAVRVDGRSVAVLYLGNMALRGNEGEIRARIQRACRLTGIKEEGLYQALDSLEWVDGALLREYEEVLELVAHRLWELGKNARQRRAGDKWYPVQTGARHWAVEAVINDICAYYDKALRLSDFAKLYFLNPQYLCKLFKKETGLSFTAYLNRHRIEAAGKLLRETDRSVLEIGMQCGFNNVTYFNKLFKRDTGLSPTDYRRKRTQKRPLL